MEAEDGFISTAEVSNNVITVPTAEVQARIKQAVCALVAWVSSCKTLTFSAFETQLVPQVLALDQQFIQLFLCLREAQFQADHAQSEPGCQWQGSIVRLLGTFFGKASYGRTYFYREGGGY